MHFKEHFSRYTKGTKFVIEVLQGIKSIAHELPIVTTPMDDDDVIIHTLNGLEKECKEVTTAIHS